MKCLNYFICAHSEEFICGFPQTDRETETKTDRGGCIPEDADAEKGGLDTRVGLDTMMTSIQELSTKEKDLLSVNNELYLNGSNLLVIENEFHYVERQRGGRRPNDKKTLVLYILNK